MAPMDMSRTMGVSSSVVYRIGITNGMWKTSELSRRGQATRRRCEYMQLRVNSLTRKDAAQATGISIRMALDIDKGIIKYTGCRIPFVPDEPDTFLYKRLMHVLDYVDSRVSIPVQVILQQRIDQRIHSRYISIEEREMIADMRNQGMGVHAIAQ